MRTSTWQVSARQISIVNKLPKMGLNDYDFIVLEFFFKITNKIVHFRSSR